MSASPSVRLDLLLVERGLVPSRERSQALIAAGLVEVDGQRATSAAQKVTQESQVRLLGRDHPWASRGGLKLAPALDHFGVAVEGRTCLDAGASTGGFTDVLLSRGARTVYAVDVGHGQLDPRLATDPRVVVMDRTNLRTLQSAPGAAPELITLDLSFISLRAVMPALVRVAPGAEVIALFKPQFELGREAVGKGGIVREPERVEEGMRDLIAHLAPSGVTQLSAPMPAAVRGTKGNQEWLLHLRLPEAAP